MKLTVHQFTEAAFIFERANGYVHSDFEKQTIEESELRDYNVEFLAQIIIEGLDSGIYKTESERVGGYWSLSKFGNKNLITNYQKWLLDEFSNKNSTAVFQLLIGLDRLDEQVFRKSRSGQAVFETELNLEDAEVYLSKIRGL